MIALEIAGATRALGAPAGWNASKDGECHVLQIVDAQTDRGTPVMISAWRPTADEVNAMLNGAPVHLQIVGSSHPPVAVYVGEPVADVSERHNASIVPMLAAIVADRVEEQAMVLLESLVLGIFKFYGREGRAAALFCETMAERLIERSGPEASA